MAGKDIQIGLDIGTSKVCAVAVEYGGEDLPRIIGTGEADCTGLKNGTIVDIESTARSIQEAISSLEESAALKVQEVTAGIAGDHIVSINCQGVIGVSGSSRKATDTGHEIDEEDVERVLESARAVVLPNGRQIVHVIPQQFLVDDQQGIRNPVGMSGRRLEARVHLVTSAISNTKNIMTAVKRNGCRIRELVLEPLAASYSTLTEEERRIGVCLVDLGAGTTDVIVLNEYGVQHSRSLPVGSSHVTSDIAKILRITDEQAEALKLTYGTCHTAAARSDRVFEVKGVGDRPDRNLNEAELAMYIEARMEEILQLIHRDLQNQSLVRGARTTHRMCLIRCGRLLPQRGPLHACTGNCEGRS